MKYACIKFLNINIVPNKCYETLIGSAWSVLTTAKISLSRRICSFKRVLILVCGSKAASQIKIKLNSVIMPAN